MIDGEEIQNRGLFAVRPYNAREVITPYAGRIKYVKYDNITTEEASYAFGLYDIGQKRCIIDGFREPREGYGMAQFCNDKRVPGAANAKIVKESDPRKEGAWLIATKDIKSGDEVLIDYGKNYWDRYDRDCVRGVNGRKDGLTRKRKEVDPGNDPTKNILNIVDDLEGCKSIDWLICEEQPSSS